MRAILLLGLLAISSAVAFQNNEQQSLEVETESEVEIEIEIEPANTNSAASVASRKATCPFIGSLVNQGLLPIQNGFDRPLGSIDVVTAMGNSGQGSTLGYVLKIFATGNHALMAAPGGNALTIPVPLGMFSLDFPGSQGSHPGHSGILQGDWRQLNTGRFSSADFARLLAKAKNGVIKRSDIGIFIGENLAKDPASKVAQGRTFALIAQDVAGVFATVGKSLATLIAKGPSASKEEVRQIAISVTKVLGENNLVGSCGEFGLLAAFLRNSPKTKIVDGEPAYSVEDLTSMFQRLTFPAGWEQWKKSAIEWVASSSALALPAAKRYHELHK